MKSALKILWLPFLLAGCSPILYAPNTLNVPMLTHRGEGNVAVHWGDEKTIQVEAAYSPVESLGVLLDVTHAKAEDASGNGGGSMTVVEAGVGRYQPLGHRFFWDTYGVFALGILENHAPSTVSFNPGSTGTIDTNFLRYGIQPSFGWRSRFADLSLSSRIVGVHHYDINGSLILNSMNVQDYLRARRNHFLIEPALTVRAGYDFIRVQIQGGTSRNITDPDFHQRKDFLSWGVVYNFGR